jgi:hypothetical protein
MEWKRSVLQQAKFKPGEGLEDVVSWHRFGDQAAIELTLRDPDTDAEWVWSILQVIWLAVLPPCRGVDLGWRDGAPLGLVEVFDVLDDKRLYAQRANADDLGSFRTFVLTHPQFVLCVHAQAAHRKGPV